MLAEVYFFDLDKTLVKVNITRKFLLYYFSKKPIAFILKLVKNFPLFIQQQIKSNNLQLAHQLILNLVKDEYEDVLLFTRTFGLKIFQNDLFLPVYEELRRAYHLGKKVVILSAAPDFIVQAISQGIGDIEAYGTIYKKNDLQVLAIFKILTGKEKADVVKKIQIDLDLDKSDLTAYSDSIQDLELLCSVGKPVVVNPDAKLHQIAKEENWRSIA